MPYLFQCAIGPVQDFISTARRSRDLWYSSWMLSELSKAAAKAIVDSGDQLIFPATSKPGDLDPQSEFNAPNKIVGVIDSAPCDVADAVDKAIRKRLHKLRDGAFKTPHTHRYFGGTPAEKQVDDLVEFYWVSVAFDGDAGYAQARRKAEALLNARKATRDFNPVNGDFKPKSSLDGIRESVIDEDAFINAADNDAEKKRKAKVLFECFGARPAERLSGVDILKRLGERGSSAASFPSTSHMAALPFLNHVDANQKAGDRSQLIAEIRELLEGRDVVREEEDGALVFSSRLAEWVPNRVERERIAKDMDKILERYAGKVWPQPYYALLSADGDNMGAAIDYLTIQPHPQDEHRKMSVSLSQFAVKVRSIVERHQGALVYSGGDDVLAYLPLHTVLPCADELAEKFSEAMSVFKIAEGVSPTLSTGIVVAHHLEPLSDALELAREAEKMAKTVDGKHGLAITVSKRSGVDRTILGRRKVIGPRLQQMVEWRRNGAIAAGVAYELQALDRVLGNSAVPEEASIAEALRTIKRKRETGGEKGVDEEKVTNNFRQWIKIDHLDLQEVAYELIIAAVFAGAIDMAEGKLKEETP